MECFALTYFISEHSNSLHVDYAVVVMACNYLRFKRLYNKPPYTEQTPLKPYITLNPYWLFIQLQHII